MQKWIHCVLEINRRESQNIKFYLDKIGEQGFELVAVVHDVDFRSYYFKRPVEEPVAPVEEVKPIIQPEPKMTEADKKAEADEIIRRTNELTPAFKNKQNEKRGQENKS